MSATMQQLEAAPVGTKVMVQTAEWERVEGGLARSGTTLEFRHFQTWLDEMSIRQPWEIGRWYMHGSNHYLLVTHRQDNRIHVLAYEEGSVDPQWRDWPETDPINVWELVTNEPPWMQRVKALHTAMSNAVPERLVQNLHRYAGNVDDEEFDELLAEHDIGRLIDHVSDVTITGTSYWLPSPAMCAEYLGAGVEIIDHSSSVEIEWRKTVQISRSGVGCTCDEIDRDTVRPHLPPDTDDFEFEAECT